MRTTAESLFRLQELEIVFEETKIVHGGSKSAELSELRRQIDEMRGTIQESVLRRYDGHRRSGTGVVRVEKGTCLGCHLRLTVGDLNRMRKCEMEWICPNCGRLLLVPASTD